jgi:hypothetical protein
LSIFTWLKNPGARGRALERLYGDDPAEARSALDTLSEEGWLEDGSLRGVDLREANLAEADLSKVDLQEVNFTDADLTGADLTEGDFMWGDFTRAELEGAKLIGTVLIDAIFENTKLARADFTGADVRGARFDGADLTGATISEDQLVSAGMLFETIMPDGTGYDGRYQCEGDEALAKREGIPVDDVVGMAEFYGVALLDYQKTVAWAEQNLDPLLDRLEAAEGDGVLQWRTIKENEYGETDTDEYSVEYHPDEIADYFELVTEAFEEPAQLTAYRRSSENHEKLLRMGALAASVILLMPFVLLALYRLLIQFAEFNHILSLGASLSRQFDTVTIFAIVQPILIIPAFFLTVWSLRQRKASILTHLAHILIYVAVWQMHGGLWAAVAYALVYVMLLAVGTQRSRRLITIIATLSLMQATPLYHLWNSIIALEFEQRRILSPFEADRSSFTYGYVYAGATIGLIEAAVIIYLIRLAVIKWIIPRTGTAAAGDLARVLMVVYALIVIAAFAFQILEINPWFYALDLIGLG